MTYLLLSIAGLGLLYLGRHLLVKGVLNALLWALAILIGISIACATVSFLAALGMIVIIIKFSLLVKRERMEELWVKYSPRVLETLKELWAKYGPRIEETLARWLGKYNARKGGAIDTQ